MIGSGIAAANLSPGDIGLQLFENAAATAAGLFTIILMFGPVSGGHFNPVVSLVDASFGGLRWRDALAYIPAQVAGCIAGAITANGMFALAAISISDKHRASEAHLLAEVIATLGLLLVIFSLARTRRGSIAPAAVGAYIGAAYFFTSSTSFANPAITVGRMFSDTFAGIAPASVPAFVVAQLVGGVVAIGVIRVLYPDITPDEAAEVMLPHEEPPPPPSAAHARSHSQPLHGICEGPSYLRIDARNDPTERLGLRGAPAGRSGGGGGGWGGVRRGGGRSVTAGRGVGGGGLGEGGCGGSGGER